MRKAIIIAMTGMLLLIFSCKKRNDNNTTNVQVTNADLAGTWEGHYSEAPDITLSQMNRFIFDNEGYVTVADSLGNASSYPGIYRISGDSVNADVSNDGVLHVKFHFKINNRKDTLNGNWIRPGEVFAGYIQQIKKSSSIISAVNVAGYYWGQFSTSDGGSTTFGILYLDQIGNATLSGAVDTIAFHGNFSVIDDSLITTINYVSSSTLNFRFKISKSDARFDGKWQKDGGIPGIAYFDRK